MDNDLQEHSECINEVCLPILLIVHHSTDFSGDLISEKSIQVEIVVKICLTIRNWLYKTEV